MRVLRTALAISQRELADKLGVTTKTVERYENVAPPKGKSLLKLYEIAVAAGQPELGEPFMMEHKRDLEMAIQRAKLGAQEFLLAAQNVTVAIGHLKELRARLSSDSRIPKGALSSYLELLDSAIATLGDAKEGNFE